MVDQADVIFAMEERHRDVIADLFPRAASKIRVMGVADPFGGTIRDYRQALADIKAGLKNFVRQRKI